MESSWTGQDGRQGVQGAGRTEGARGETGKQAALVFPARPRKGQHLLCSSHLTPGASKAGSYLPGNGNPLGYGF